MVDDFLIARNPDESSSLGFLVRIPLGRDGVVLKVRDTWPRTSKVYCHPADGWPSDAEVVERVAVRSCVRRGAAIDLVLDRGREHRSQFVFTRARGREVIFWQTARTARQARPDVALPTRRAAGRMLEIVVDSRERYPWRFERQQATTQRRALAAGDYAVEWDGGVVGAVERKSLADLASTVTSGKMRYVLAELAAVPRAAVVVEDRYSSVFRLEHVRPAIVAEGLAEAQVRFPSVPIVFCETRPLAQEWAYRFLGAALEHHLGDETAAERAGALPTAAGVPTAPVLRPGDRHGPSAASVRAWAREHGIEVASRGRIPADVLAAFVAAHPDG